MRFIKIPNLLKLFNWGNPITMEDMMQDDIYIQPLSARKTTNIIIDKQIRGKYRKGWIHKIRKKPITEVVLHGTAGGTSEEAMLRWMYNGERAKEYNRGVALFHYLIGRDGDTVEVIDTDYWVYHSSSKRHDKTTIGIELINPSKMNDAQYTADQYTSLFKLIFDHLIPTYPTITKIVSHRYNRIVYGKKKDRRCPGLNFSWSKLDHELHNRNYVFKTDGHLRHKIQIT